MPVFSKHGCRGADNSGEWDCDILLQRDSAEKLQQIKKLIGNRLKNCETSRNKMTILDTEVRIYICSAVSRRDGRGSLCVT